MSDAAPELVRLRLFLSVDIVGSSAFKGRPRIYQHADSSWLEVISHFFTHFSPSFMGRCAKNWEEIIPGTGTPDKPVVWKTLGDEIIFSVAVRNHEHIVFILDQFLEEVAEFEKDNFTKGPLRLKTAAWCANFPYPNVEIPAKTLNPLLQDPNQLEFIGPTIDTGFRLSKKAKRGVTIVSLELAELIAKGIKQAPGTSGHLYIKHYGWELLPGVIGDKPYPLFWFWRDKPRLDHWEVEFKGALGIKGNQCEPCDAGEVVEFTARVRAELTHLDVIEALFAEHEASEDLKPLLRAHQVALEKLTSQPAG